MVPSGSVDAAASTLTVSPVVPAVNAAVGGVPVAPAMVMLRLSPVTVFPSGSRTEIL